MTGSIDGMRTNRATQKNNTNRPPKFKRTIAGLIVLWVVCLIVIASVGFSSYMVYYGTDDSTAKMLILPQVIAAVSGLVVLPIVAIVKVSELLSNK